MISLATETDRTLFFDFLPLDLGTVRGFKTRIHLYTVPGQVFYDASRKLILRGVDGIVFVADSQQERQDANVEALDNLMTNLKEHGYDFNKIPYVLQLNKPRPAKCTAGGYAHERTAQEKRGGDRGCGLPGRGVFEDAEGNRQAGAHGVEAGRVGQCPVASSQLSVLSKTQNKSPSETWLAASAFARVVTGL